MRATFGSILLLHLTAILPALADDAPAPLTEEKRAELVAGWRKAYDAEVAKQKETIQKAKVLLTNMETAARGEEKIARANEVLAALKRDPFIVGVKVLNHNAKDTWLGRLPHTTGSVVKTDAAATVVDIAYLKGTTLGATGFNVPSGGTPAVIRFALLPPLPKAKPKLTVPLSGLWYVDGTIPVDGQPVQLLKRVEVKKDELPGAAPKKP